MHYIIILSTIHMKDTFVLFDHLFLIYISLNLIGTFKGSFTLATKIKEKNSLSRSLSLGVKKPQVLLP